MMSSAQSKLLVRLGYNIIVAHRSDDNARCMLSATTVMRRIGTLTHVRLACASVSRAAMHRCKAKFITWIVTVTNNNFRVDHFLFVVVVDASLWIAVIAKLTT